MNEMTIPVSTTKWLTITSAFPLTDQEWKQLIAALEAMKPAMVK